MTFHEFVKSRPYTDNPLGDLADDIREDRTFPKVTEALADLRYQLRRRSASAGAIRAAKDLWAEYKTKAPAPTTPAARVSPSRLEG